MTLKHSLIGYALAIAAMLAVPPAQAAQPFETTTSWLQGFDDWISELDQMQRKDFQFSLGAGIGVTPDYPGADNYEAVGLPLFQLRYKDKLTLDPLGLRFRIWRNDRLRLRLTLGPSESRSADADTPIAKLNDVDRGLNTGLILEGRIAGPVAFRLNMRKEIAGGHDGFNVSPSVGVILTDKTKTYTVIPEIAVDWSDDNYMNAFYAVMPARAAAANLAPYNPSSGFRDILFRVTTSYRFNEHWIMLGRAQAGYLLGDAKKSPIVRTSGDAFQSVFGFGIMYNF